MALKAGQGKEEEESRARQQKEKTPVRDEEKTPACDGRGHHVVEQGCPHVWGSEDNFDESFLSIHIHVTYRIESSFLSLL
ncbi:hypothetical protein STEG23_012070, partial [Scotinomys teguina]